MDRTVQSPTKLKPLAALKKLNLGQPEPAFAAPTLQALADNCLGITDLAAVRSADLEKLALRSGIRGALPYPRARVRATRALPGVPADLRLQEGTGI